MSESTHQHVAGLQVRVVDTRRPLRHYQLVEVAPDTDEPGPAARRRLGQLCDDVAARPQLPGETFRHEMCGFRSTVRSAETDEGVHPLITTEPLHVVTRDQ